MTRGGSASHDIAVQWEDHATWWQRSFTLGGDPEYEEQLLPLLSEQVGMTGAGRVLEVGTGEGQVARRVAGTAGLVVGVDSSAAQLAEATRRGGGPSYARARAERLPFPGASFDAVVACLVLEHVEDLWQLCREVSRVLVPTGSLVVALNHPLLSTPSSGWVDDHILEEQYWRVGPYLEEAASLEEVEPGVSLTFLHRPLSAYVNALAAAGLRIVWMLEPAPPPELFGGGDGGWPIGSRDRFSIPRMMLMRAEKAPAA
ncbi:MAG: class I SAM-dependent methyltransferase [Acidimicrobiales bacterium]